MKQIFSIVSALVLSGTMFAQTIAIDGANTDWSTVPMLTEPGVSPVVKMVVPQAGLTLPEGAAFALMVEGEHEKILAGFPVIYTDADKSATTTINNDFWLCPMMGPDYEMATWSTGSLFAPYPDASKIREMCIMQDAFGGIKFTGSVWATLNFAWGGLYIPTAPNGHLSDPSNPDSYKWSNNQYHPFDVRPYAYADLAGTHAAAQAYSTHEALQPGETLQLSKNEFDTEFWVSWTVELKKAAKYTVSANVTATNTTSLDLSLVDVATNKVVATFAGEEMWAPTGATTYGEWDLSKVPAGKYMLKAKNHVQWSEMVLSSVTLTEKGVGSAVEDVVVNTKATKVIKNGQMMIVRDNVQYNVLGGIVK